MTMQPEVHFYFDYISHNAYLAWTQLPRLVDRYAVRVRLLPVLFAGLLNHHGQKGPAEIRAKVHWMTKDVLRKASRLGIPLQPPASHPFNPLTALRLTLLPMDESLRWRLVDALFKATWAESRDISRPEVVAAVATEIGLDGAALLAQAQQPEAKQMLQDYTQQAIERGVFGVPTMIVSDELFWGFDDLLHLELFLDGQDSFDAQEFSAWLDVKASSRRRPPDAKGR